MDVTNHVLLPVVLASNQNEWIDILVINPIPYSTKICFHPLPFHRANPKRNLDHVQVIKHTKKIYAGASILRTHASSGTKYAGSLIGMKNEWTVLISVFRQIKEQTAYTRNSTYRSLSKHHANVTKSTVYYFWWPICAPVGTWTITKWWGYLAARSFWQLRPSSLGFSHVMRLSRSFCSSSCSSLLLP